MSEDRLGLLEYYSNNTPPQYTEEIKVSIVNALFPDLAEDAINNKILRLQRRTPKLIKQLCKSKLEAARILEHAPALEKKHEQLERLMKHSLEQQEKQQDSALEDGLIKKFTSLSYHTLVDRLSKNTSDAEYKFQTSWSPIFEDENNIIHNVIEPSPTYQYDPYELIVRNSVFDVRKMPLELLHLAIYGTLGEINMKGEKELDLLLIAAEKIEEIKTLLIDAKPLRYQYTNNVARDYTQRIMQLIKDHKGVGYMLSENTHTVYEEKSLRKYTNNMIRYKIFTDKSALLVSLIAELPFAEAKLHPRAMRLDLLDKFPSLKETYADSAQKKIFIDLIDAIRAHLETQGLTETEQKIRDSANRIGFQNRATDATIVLSMRKTLVEGIFNQNKKIEYLRTHIDALEKDTDF